MHPELYLPMQRLIERERDERLAHPRSRPVTGAAADAGAARAEPRSPLSRALASLRTAAAPSSCCAMA